MNNQKQNLRKWAKEERKKLNIEELSQKLVLKLKDTKEYQTALNIMIYYPLINEINLLKLLEDTTKNFYLPKISGNQLLCCPYNSNDELCYSCFKTKEPTTTPIEKNLIDLVIIPALAVDKNNHRLGYGGGFYDRFLENCNATKLVCIPEILILQSIFAEKHDIKVDKVISV